MMIPFFYKVYVESPLATLTNILMRLLSFGLVLSGLCFWGAKMLSVIAAVIIIAGGIAAFILSTALSNFVAKKTDEKRYGKNYSRLKALIPMQEKQVIENGQYVTKSVPDIVEGPLDPPAKINIYREKSGLGKVQYCLNGKPVAALRNEETATVLTSQAENRMWANIGPGDHSRSVEIIVRPGEEVTISYTRFFFKDMKRH